MHMSTNGHRQSPGRSAYPARYSAAALFRRGLASQLRGQGIELVDERQLDEDSVAVLISDEIDDQAVREIRALRRRGVQRIVVVATHAHLELDDLAASHIAIDRGIVA